MRHVMAATLLTFCSALALTGCGDKRTALAIKPPPERLACIDRDGRPTLPPEHVIDWTKVKTVDQAHAEHDSYVKSVRDRNGVVSGYVVDLEGRLFLCSNNAAWLRDFYAKLPEDPD
jgi:hypothetical protein